MDRTPWLNIRILRKIFKNEDFVIQSVYAGALVSGVEPADPAYQRVLLDKNLWSDETEVPELKEVRISYMDVISWPKATQYWGMVNEMFLVDAPTGGNMLYRKLLTNPIEIHADDQLKVDAEKWMVIEGGN